MRKSKTILDFFKSPSNKNGNSPIATGSSSSYDQSAKEKNDDKTPKTTEETPLRWKRRHSNEKNEQNSLEKLAESTDEKISDTKQTKRRRIVIASDSDDSNDDYEPEKDDAVSESEDNLNSDDSFDSETPRKKGKNVKKLTKNVPSFDAYKHNKSPSSILASKPSSGTPLSSLYSSSPNQAQTSKSFSNSSFNQSPKTSRKSSEQASQKKGPMDNEANYLHERLDWLMPKNIKDKHGRHNTHPDYDPTTLYVPESFKKTLTPGLKQWWDIKSEHFDTVLFFKVGKFYEFYHMDADIGVKELDLCYMKGDFAHAGFPEVAFGKFSDILIQKGYKVARIEQTETPQMMEQRCKKTNRPTKYDRVVRREVCQVTSKGTRTLAYEEWHNNLGANSNFLLALCEKPANQDTSTFEYGICFVDTTIGKFTLGQFTDDRHQSRLLSFIGIYPPVEILLDKSSVSQKTSKLFNSNLSGVSKQLLGSNSFWDADKTLKFLIDSKYYMKEGDIQLPYKILEMLDKDDKLYQTPLKCYELAFKSLGACIWYLKKCFIEDCLLTMSLFEIYKPSDETCIDNKLAKISSKHMILDNVTLRNLAIVPSQNLKFEESLFGTLNYCETSFGKRELRKWLCSPLCQPEEINDRLLAIDDLRDIPIYDKVRRILRKIPDLERLLNKIHVHGLVRSKDHPETRAVFYELEVYNKRKIIDLNSTLDGFTFANHIAVLFAPYVSKLKSKILKECVDLTVRGNHFPDGKKILSHFTEAYDLDKAVKQGSIVPKPGVDKDYETACKEIEDVTMIFEMYKGKQRKILNCEVKYVHVGKNRYLLEAPENQKFPSDYEFLGGRKGFKRFYTKQLKELLSRLTAAEDARDSALRDCTRKVFEAFDKCYVIWQRTVECLSTLDVLFSLTHYCKMSSDGKMCKPVFLSGDETKPYLEIIDGRHPVFEDYFFTDKDYIPNSICIGKTNEGMNTKKVGNLILVTGPNMGGKSTLMRQTGTLLVLAHLGCYVPAESMVLTPVDRIFTRVGANDQIYKGESTFFVESSETASILHHATCHSFVLIDELGRGTSTYDGTAIAYATADYLANDIGCRTLFSTHYHSLVEDFRSDSNIGLGHMACMVEEDNDCPTLEKVTFLYKFVDGACPKSYGFNVALLAGIDKEIVSKGFRMSQQVDYITKISKSFRKLLSKATPEEIINLLSHKLNAV